MIILFLAFINLFSKNNGVSCFSSSPQAQRSVMKMESSLLDKIPNPFASQSGAPDIPSAFKSDTSFNPTADGLVLRAKAVLSADFGVLDETLLDDNFIWIGPSLGSKVLGKADFLAAGKFFDLRSTFPDLDYRPHDFRVDEKEPLTIRLTTRTVGSMRGDLRLRNEIVPPSGVRMVCPPEAVTMTFTQTGKLVKLCSGFAMDRLVGNTGGLCGVMGAAAVAGVPPSDWEVYPVTTVLQRFLGRPVEQLEEPSNFLAPFPEQVMIQLAKGIIAADMAELDPDLLDPSFSFCTPFVGPVDKESYIKLYAKKVLGKSDPELTNFRVDPYDPYRVWLDVLPASGCPQAMSFAFDDDGFCTRITAWAVMDPSVGKSGGLGGENGVQYASGSAPPGIIARPLPQVFGRLQQRLFSIVTKVGVDEYRLEGTSQDGAEVRDKKVIPRPPAVPKELIPKRTPEKILPTATSPFSPLSLQPKVASSNAASEKKVPTKKPLSPLSLNAPTLAPKKPSQKTPTAGTFFAGRKSISTPTQAKGTRSLPSKQKPIKRQSKTTRAAVQQQNLKEQQAKKERQREEQMKARQEAKERANTLAAERKRAAELKKQEQARRQEEARQLAAEKKKEAAQAAAERSRQRAEQRAAKEAAMQVAAEAKRKEVEAKRAASAAKATKAMESAKPGATIPLFGFGGATETKDGVSKMTRAKATKAEAKAKATKAMESAKPGATISLFGFGGATKAEDGSKPSASSKTRRAEATKAAAKAKATKSMESAKPGATISLFGFGGAAKAEDGSKPSSSSQARREAIKSKAARQNEAMQRNQAKQASRAVEKASPGATISLFPFGRDAEDDVGASSKQVAPKKSAGPRGVPRISGWTENKDGSISGKIFGAAGFREGEVVTTSPLRGAASGGQVVQTVSGSKYYLEPQSQNKDGAGFFGRFGGKAQSTSSPTDKAAVFRRQSSPKQEVNTFKRKPSEGNAKAAPRGVPTLTKWRQNFDKSLTGQISGSTMFEDGEKITTSEITVGDVSKGSVVQTSSGSKYFLN